MECDVIVVGSGLTGSVIANRLAKRKKKVLVIEQRDHVGGNVFDYKKDGINIHQYGPHIFHTNHEDVFEYLSEFTEWYKYEHRVLGHIDDKLVPIPFNFKSIDECMPNKAESLKSLLIEDYGEDKKVSIIELLKNDNKDIKELADYIFEKVFKYYTMKQWGLKIEELDSSIFARVPVYTSYNDRYFNDKYQYMPKGGYIPIIKKLLDNRNITVKLNSKAKEHISLINGKIYFNSQVFTGEVYYTGMIDELFNYEFGELSYRSLNLKLSETNNTFQKVATENYPCPKEEKDFTRITEYKHFLEIEKEGKSYIHIEYPTEYVRDINIPFYPITSEDNEKRYEKYAILAKEYSNLHLIGRLAEYKHYDMDTVVKKALEITKE